MKKYIKPQKSYYKTSILFTFVCLLLLFVSCTEKKHIEPIIIWTNKSELVGFAELFNASSENAKAVIIYKENPAASFNSVTKDEIPDIVIGSWLNSSETANNFLPITYLFEDQLISESQFYPQLLKHGQIRDQQYLLPVSFNIPAIIYSITNEQYVTENTLITTEEIKTAAATFNKTEKEHYVAMGYAPSWEPEFMYEVAKLNGADFLQPTDKDSLFSWEEGNLQNTVGYFIDWTKEHNSTTESESTYKYKYLSNPVLNNVSSNRMLFTYMPSNELFVYPEERLETVRFKWLHKNNQLLIQDEMLSMGLYKHSKNVANAEEFIIWFMNPDNQEDMLQWTNSVNLYTKPFGIAGGFSSIRSVNERYFPVEYPQLWGNLPLQENLVVPNELPEYWQTIKEQVLLPYLQEASVTPSEIEIESVQSRVNKVYRYE